MPVLSLAILPVQETEHSVLPVHNFGFSLPSARMPGKCILGRRSFLKKSYYMAPTMIWSTRF